MADQKTKDAGWQIGLSRTVPLEPEEVWARIERPADADADEREPQRAHWSAVLDRPFG